MKEIPPPQLEQLGGVRPEKSAGGPCSREIQAIREETVVKKGGNKKTSLVMSSKLIKKTSYSERGHEPGRGARRGQEIGSKGERRKATGEVKKESRKGRRYLKETRVSA